MAAFVLWAELEKAAQPGASRRSKLVCGSFSFTTHCCCKPARDAGVPSAVQEAAPIQPLPQTASTLVTFLGVISDVFYAFQILPVDNLRACAI